MYLSELVYSINLKKMIQIIILFFNQIILAIKKPDKFVRFFYYRIFLEFIAITQCINNWINI